MSQSIKVSWDNAYATLAKTNWEMIPLSDMSDFLRATVPELTLLRSALEFGCGRSLRTFITLLTLEALNRPSFNYIGVDLSTRAIAASKEVAAALRLGRQEFPLSNHLKEFLGSPLPRLRCEVNFLAQNIFDYSGTQLDYHDLIIDWMCFHDLCPEEHENYLKLMLSCCSRYLVIKVFSKECSSFDKLGEAVSGVRKYSFSQRQIEKLFYPHFRTVAFEQYPEDLNPIPPPADRFVTAKRAYLLERL